MLCMLAITACISKMIVSILKGITHYLKYAALHGIFVSTLKLSHYLKYTALHGISVFIMPLDTPVLLPPPSAC